VPDLPMNTTVGLIFSSITNNTMFHLLEYVIRFFYISCFVYFIRMCMGTERCIPLAQFGLILTRNRCQMKASFQPISRTSPTYSQIYCLLTYWSTTISNEKGYNMSLYMHVSSLLYIHITRVTSNSWIG
jgi:hypothetical protein